MNQIGPNVVHFGRLLRAAGMPVGPDRIIHAQQVLALTGLHDKRDVRHALATVLVDRHENQALFDAAFQAYWQDPKLLENALNDTVAASHQSEDKTATTRRANRLDQALSQAAVRQGAVQETPGAEQQADAAMSFSDNELLQQADFDAMSEREFRQATRLVRQLALPLRPVTTRRFQAATNGAIDLRRSLQQMRRDPDTLTLANKARRVRPPSLVVLLDISGSMERYARIFLHFVHAMTRRYQKVDTLVFGTRLTNISRCLRDRDVDVALASAARLMQDWRGGTRIATSLQVFNHHWARRLLTGNATLILVSDGLDRDEHGNLAAQARRLRGFARQIIWLNPLLRYDGFEPKAAGIRALLPQVDHFLPMHNLASLADLGNQLHNSKTIKGPL